MYGQGEVGAGRSGREMKGDATLVAGLLQNRGGKAKPGAAELPRCRAGEAGCEVEDEACTRGPLVSGESETVRLRRSSAVRLGANGPDEMGDSGWSERPSGFGRSIFNPMA